MKFFRFVPLIAIIFFASCSAKNDILQTSQAENENIESIIKGSLDKDGKVVITHINFEKDSVEAPEGSDESIKTLADYLKENTAVTMNVACYTDNDGTPAYCVDLSKKRARNLSDKFKKYGVDESRINFSGEGWKPGTNPEALGERIEIELVH